MAFRSFAQQKLDMTGDLDQILERTDYERIFTIRDGNGVAIDMTEWDTVAPRCQFRNLPIKQNGQTTNCPQPILTWDNASGGRIKLRVPVSAYNAISSANLVTAGVYQIEVVHDGTGEPTAGKVARPFYGDWAIVPEVTQPD